MSGLWDVLGAFWELAAPLIGGVAVFALIAWLCIGGQVWWERWARRQRRKRLRVVRGDAPRRPTRSATPTQMEHPHWPGDDDGPYPPTAA